MKKFLIFLAVIFTVLGLGFGTYYLLKDDETLTISQSTQYVNVGDSFSVEFKWEKPRTGSVYEVIVGDSDLIERINDDQTAEGVERFRALTGGYTTITFASNNKNVPNVSQTVYIGDGLSLATPFYISEQNIKDIGVTSEFTLDKTYKLIKNIDLAGSYWTPIGLIGGQEFTGNFEGNGFTISNLTINPEHFDIVEIGPGPFAYNLGFVNKIGVGGAVVNVKFNNVLIEAEHADRVGIVAAESNGEIERVEISNANIAVNNSTALGGVVGYMSSLEVYGESYSRTAAEIDRVTTKNVVIGAKLNTVMNVMEYGGVSGRVGGLVGEATGGVIVYSYSRGEVYLQSGAIYGGLVGASEFISYQENPDGKYLYIHDGIRIRDSYSSIVLSLSNMFSNTDFIESQIDLAHEGLEASFGENYQTAAQDKFKVSMQELLFYLISRSFTYQGQLLEGVENLQLNEVDYNNVVITPRFGGIIGMLTDTEMKTTDDIAIANVGVYRIFGTYYNQEFTNNVSETLHETGILKHEMNGIGTYRMQYNTNISSMEYIPFYQTDPDFGEFSREYVPGSEGGGEWREKQRPYAYFPIDLNKQVDEFAELNYLPSDLARDRLIRNNTNFIIGLTEYDFENQDLFISHGRSEIAMDGNIPTESRKTVYWNFEELWRIEGGYPTITYENIKIANNVEAVRGRLIGSTAELQNMKWDGRYIIIADLLFTNPNKDKAPGDEGYDETWKPFVPIGTEAYAFTGSLESAWNMQTNTYFKIVNLVVDGAFYQSEGKQTKFGGLFGVTSGERGGYARNLIIENATISGYETAGVLAGSNGVDITDSKGNVTSYPGIDISHVKVLTANVSGEKYVGGLVGLNNGKIEGVTVSEALQPMEGSDNFTSLGATKIQINATGQRAAIGGIAGVNRGTINRSFVNGNTQIDALQSTGAGINIGGLVGENSGVIFESGAIDAKLVGQPGIAGNFGGLVGLFTEGKIESSVVSVVIQADAENTSVVAGGVAGKMFGTGFITKTLVNNSTIDAHTIGGIVGQLEFYKERHTFKYEFDNRGNLVNDAQNRQNVSVDQVGVTGVVLAGNKVAGLVGTLTNGIVQDSYFVGTLNGINEKSVKAGAVLELPRSVTEGLKAGVVQRVYIAATFGDNGKSYAMSESQFLHEPIIREIPFTGIKFERRFGFIVNYMFDDQVDRGAAHPEPANWFLDTAWANISHGLNNLVDWFPKYGKLSPSTTNEMVSSAKYAEFNFDLNLFTFNSTGANRSYPTLKALDGLQDRITKIQVKHKVGINHWLEELTGASSTSSEVFENNTYTLYTIYNLGNGQEMLFKVDYDREEGEKEVKVYLNSQQPENLLLPNSQGVYTTGALFNNAEIIIVLLDK